MIPSDSKRTLRLAVLVGLTLALLFGLWTWRQGQRHKLEQEFIQAELNTIVSAKRREIEGVFANVYQNLRTISLLPSVRAIPHGNRKDDKEDVIATGRFTDEGHETVQQVYNNLKATVSVSEVYAVIDGLDSAKGEVPFFMYDALVFGQPKAEAAESKSPDTPEQAETSEYEFFPKQIEAIKAAQPEFKFSTLDDIPAYASPMMRTCDNEQYVSKAKGNEHETFGMLYSVPFYQGADGHFKGVISAIIRSNVFEAALMGVPFVPVTEEDNAKQKSAGWALPQAARFTLSNEKYGITIQDRRNTELSKAMASGIEGRNVFRLPLNVRSDSPWVLTYYLSESLIAAELAQSDRTFYAMVAVALAVLAVAVVSLVLLGGIRRAVGEVGKFLAALSNGNFTQRVTGNLRGALGKLKVDSNQTVDKLSGVVREIRQTSDSLSSAASEIVHGNTDIRNRTDAQLATLGKVATSLEGLTHMAKQSATTAEQANRLAHGASEEATQCGVVVGQVVSTMQQIDTASKRIAEIISVIDGIAFQTNILALNAAVEAARAGEQGRGFAVVASEVRSLSLRSAQAAKEIKDLIADSVNKVAAGRSLVDQAGSTMNEVVASIQRTTEMIAVISKDSSAQSRSVDEVHATLSLLGDESRQGSASVARASESAADLEELASGLRSLVAAFKLDVDSSSSGSLLGPRKAFAG